VTRSGGSGPCSQSQRSTTLDERLREFPRGALDYLWLVNPPPYDPRLTAGLEVVWTNGRSVLFRLRHGDSGLVPADES
jgi:hypothetical protein